ncbi:hypothetical protein V5O48_001842 [Marasmius crinis-equi]|uniref:Uncharacterized protein n=1 Tax=Marasmius crinis-equi TaxID=585013 RepID=A0ABR3FXQ5_9AGAR
MVQRSRSLPLHIRLDENTMVRSPTSFCALAKRSFQAMKVLSCSVRQSRTLEVLFRCLRDYPPSRLESLTLTVDDRTSSLRPSLPASFHSPNRFNLDKWIDWGTGWLCGLTSLSLVLKDLPVSLERLANLIQKSPLLERLLLIDVSISPSAQLDPSLTILLPRLKTLEIGGCSSDTLLHLLVRVEIPPATSVVAHFPDPPPGTLPENLCVFLRRICRGREVLELQYTTDHLDEGDIVLMIRDNTLTVASSAVHSTTPLLDCFTLAFVNRLVINTGALFDDLMQRRIRSMHDLRVVVIGNRSRAGFLDLVDAKWESDTPPFPKLTKVELDSWVDDYWDFPDAPWLEQDLQRLLGIFERRYSSGYPIAELVFSDFVACKGLNAFNGAARAVTWHDRDDAQRAQEFESQLRRFNCVVSTQCFKRA